MSDLLDRAQRARDLIGDNSLARHERAERALRAFAGLRVDLLQRSVQDQLDREIAAVNRLLEPYRLREGDDYQMLSEADLKRLLVLIETAASHAIDAELDRIMAALDAGVDTLPEDAIRETREHRNLVVPRLIQALKDAIAGARRGELPKGNAHFFALFLLTDFKAQEAFPVLQEALTLPDDLPDELFGDAVHELPPRIFALFLGDRVEAIEALVDDRSLDYLPRWNAAHSYMHLVCEGRMNREEAVGRLHHHLRRAVDQADTKIVTPLVIELAYYTPAEAIETIREAYQRRLVDGFISLEEIEEEIAKGESRLEKQLARCSSLDVDTIAELSRWSSFQCKSNVDSFDERSATPPEPTAMPLSPTTKPQLHQGGARLAALDEPIASRQPRVGRNDPCPCGSGKKFKKCCGSRKG